MECKNCHTEQSEAYEYCPYCGHKHNFTRSDFMIALERTKRYFSSYCKKQRVPKDVSGSLERACWEYAGWKFADLYKYYGRDMTEILPLAALDELSQVATQAKNLFDFILEY